MTPPDTLLKSRNGIKNGYATNHIRPGKDKSA